MLKDITLGQYFPGNSIIHKTDPRMKIIITVIYITTIFLADSLPVISVIFLSTVLLILLSGISLIIIVKALKPLVFLMAFTVIVNIFWTSGETLLFSYGIVKIYKEGLLYAAMMMLRLISLISAASILITYTTSPTVFTDALERLLNPLKKIKVPVHEFSMMMMIALRMIPTLTEETDKIINAQKARGADFYSGNLIRRAKALIPILIPLLVSAFRRADELATAMECRCYKGGNGRTKMKQLKYAPADFLMLLAFIIFSVLIICLRLIY